jgi:SAM-dependent methyltransferase
LGTEIDLCYLQGVLRAHGLWNSRLLDLGCGQGRLEHGLIGAGWEAQNLYLVDASPAGLDIARTLCPAAHLSLHDVEEGIPFAGPFDCILMVEFLEDLTDPRPVVAAALEALRPGGLLVVRGMPNNESFEAFVGREQWKMRAMDHHYQFLNPRTFARLVDSLPGGEILSFGCFLQPGYRFYHVARIARDLGLVGRHAGPETPTAQALADRVLRRIRAVNLDRYPHRERLPVDELAALSTPPQIQAFFDHIHLDYLLAPDFSAVVQRIE